MCEDQRQPAKLLVVSSLTQLSSRKKCCKVNNGSTHWHCIRVENQRREKAHIWGTVTTRSARNQLLFDQGGGTSAQWAVDLLAYGQRVSTQEATIVVGAVHSSNEDIEANLQCQYDDPFNPKASVFSLTIPVTL